MRLVRLWVALSLALPGTDLGAQTSNELLDRGIRAYADVDLDAAVGFFRRWFASADAAGAPASDRRRALTYLGAAEALRGNRDSAAAAFERLVVLDPRFRIDELLFPPEITTLFSAIRQRTKVVTVETEPRAEFHPEGGAYSVRVIASSAHPIRAVLRQPDGRTVRVVYTGFIGDSTDLHWDGRDSTGNVISSGSYLLEIHSSTVVGDAVARVLQLPLDISVERPDTLPHPPAPLDTIAPAARAPAGPGAEALAGGLAAAAVAALLPAVLAPGADIEAVRFIVAGITGGAGLVGFVRNLPGRPIGNPLVTAAALDAWRGQVAAAIAENRARRASARIIVLVGEPTAADLRLR